MKTTSLQLFILTALSFLPVLVQAQSFRFDTIPATKSNSERSYQFERTENRQNNQTTSQNRSLQVEPATETEKKQSFDPNRLVFGGSFGLSFGDYTTVNISPQLGYAITDKFVAGGGVSYNYYRYSHHDLSLHYWGMNVYARYHPLRYISLQLQPEIYGISGKRRGSSIDTRAVPVVLVGVGGILPVGYRSGLSIMLYYDLVQDDWSPYEDQLFFTFGYTFRF